MMPVRNIEAPVGASEYVAGSHVWKGNSGTFTARPSNTPRKRRPNTGALAWAAGITMHAAMAAMLLLDADLAAWSGRHVAAWLGMLLAISYALIRGWLHRRYA